MIITLLGMNNYKQPCRCYYDYNHVFRIRNQQIKMIWCNLISQQIGPNKSRWQPNVGVIKKWNIFGRKSLLTKLMLYLYMDIFRGVRLHSLIDFSFLLEFKTFEVDTIGVYTNDLFVQLFMKVSKYPKFFPLSYQTQSRFFSFYIKHKAETYAVCCRRFYHHFFLAETWSSVKPAPLYWLCIAYKFTDCEFYVRCAYNGCEFICLDRKSRLNIMLFRFMRHSSTRREYRFMWRFWTLTHLNPIEYKWIRRLSRPLQVFPFQILIRIHFGS